MELYSVVFVGSHSFAQEICIDVPLVSVHPSRLLLDQLLFPLCNLSLQVQPADSREGRVEYRACKASPQEASAFPEPQGQYLQRCTGHEAQQINSPGA